MPGWKLRQNWNGVSSLRSQEIRSCGIRPHEVAIRSYGGLALCYRVRHLALGDIYALKVCNTAGASAVQASERAMHAVSRAVPHHSCRPLAILIELHRHAAVHDEPPRANLVADPELAATLQPITLLREPGPRLEAQRHNTFDSLADQRANDFVFRCQEPALVHGRANRHRVGQRELGVRRAE